MDIVIIMLFDMVQLQFFLEINRKKHALRKIEDMSQPENKLQLTLSVTTLDFAAPGRLIHLLPLLAHSPSPRPLTHSAR